MAAPKLETEELPDLLRIVVSTGPVVGHQSLERFTLEEAAADEIARQQLLVDHGTQIAGDPGSEGSAE